jgi:hypothetical protein
MSARQWVARSGLLASRRDGAPARRHVTLRLSLAFVAAGGWGCSGDDASGPEALVSQSITAIMPATGLTHEGTALTISGSGFATGATVTIGGKPATNVRVIDTRRISALAPPNDAGLADVVITSSNGTTSSSGAFRYVVSRSGLEQALTQRFLERHGVEIPRPALLDNFACGGTHVTTTAYLDPAGKTSKLMVLYTSIEGNHVTVRQSWSAVIRPAGIFRILTVLVAHPQTIDEGSLALLQAGQARINDDHASFARARGYAAPIVTFDYTNVIIDAGQVADPRTPAGVTAALAEQGQSIAGYDFLVSINIDPSRSEGGFARFGTQPAFIYMGNYMATVAPPTASEFISIASATYHHEVFHHWGWAHDWGGCSPPTAPPFNFWVAPVLLGWEDVDDDGIPEILDPTPYGRLAATPP